MREDSELVIIYPECYKANLVYQIISDINIYIRCQYVFDDKRIVTRDIYDVPLYIYHQVTIVNGRLIDINRLYNQSSSRNGKGHLYENTTSCKTAVDTILLQFNGGSKKHVMVINGIYIYI